MLPGWILLLVSLGYAALLFAVAWWGDRHPVHMRAGGSWLRPLVYSLSLAVYCSSWTFYGAVGTATRTGLGYFAIYLGPLLMLLFGWRILERLALVAQDQNTVSIADFIAARYGRTQRLAALVSLIALIAAVPYLALQYKAVALSLQVLGGRDPLLASVGDPALYVAVLMALFAILYGTRQVDATEHRPGMMLAIALESLVKLVALVFVGVFALFWSSARELPLAEATRALVSQGMPAGFISQTLLAFTAIICLPRQFHVAVVECTDVNDIRRARWMFGGYLVLVTLAVLPIAAAGLAMPGVTGGAGADTLVLGLPLSEGRNLLALFAYVGGFSAATGMVIVSSVALATMVSNDLVMPPLLARGWAQRRGGGFASTVLWIRRIAIVCFAALAWGYYRLSSSETTLASYGLMSFAAVAQFAPALIGGLYWRGASRQGMEAGLLLGFALWTYTLLLPTLTGAGWMDDGWMLHGPFGIEWLRPQQLFGLGGWDPLTHGTFWSLLANVGALFLVSARWRPSFEERLRTAPFLDPYASGGRPAGGNTPHPSMQVGDLLALAGRFVGDATARRAFADHARAGGGQLQPSRPSDRNWAQFTERLMAAAIGAASSRLVMTSALKGSGMDVAEVVAVLDEAGQELRFDRGILSATLDNLDQGVSVVDADMRLVSWNLRYARMFDYPDGMLYVGRPVADLIRYNARRGELGERPDVQAEVDKRIAHMRAGTPHVFERVRASGQVVEMRGQPLPGGGYVTSYSDVTEYKRVEDELREMNETLEQRVAIRTREAEAAQASRTRFLAAVSHDVLQPLNAARLFTSALRESGSADEQRHLAERVDTSLRAAEELLEGLLDVSRLDAGALQPQLADFDAAELLSELAAQYAPLAAARGIGLRVIARPLPVRSDRSLLRRVLQNFMANALRHTRRGRVLLTARVRAQAVELQVWDTGPGIPEYHLQQIFEEFFRIEDPDGSGAQGLGLGLSICQRISNVLGHPLNVRSRRRHGSMFSILVPRAAKVDAPRPVPAGSPALSDGLDGMRVLCVDNDADILAGMANLLGRWGIVVLQATTVDEALECMAGEPDVLLVDYHLHDRMDGLDALDALREHGPRVPGALVTADGSDALKREAHSRGYRVLTKPVKPASLRAFLAARSSPHAAGHTP